jgi:hypothetical protein
MKYSLRSLMIAVLVLPPLLAAGAVSLLYDPSVLFFIACAYVIGYLFYRAI